MRHKTMLSFHSKTGTQELHAVLTTALLFTAIIIRGCDGCRMLIFQPPMNDSYLYRHVNKSYVIETKAHCEHKCYFDADCMSTNTGILDNGKFLCELSDSDHKLHPEDLKFREGFTYTATENFCVNHSCSPHGRCQIGFTNKGYHCVCSTGFTGQFCNTRVGLGLGLETPGKSCKHLLDSGFSVGDGEYWIDPGSFENPLNVFCDMTTDGGGWLLVSSIVAKNDSTVQTDSIGSYREIRKHRSNTMLMTISALRELRGHLNFTQLRFHCSKKLGRTFHVATVVNKTGEAVIQYFTDLTDVLPESCGSFQRMSDDNSTLSVSCGEWGNNPTASAGKWGHVSNKGENRLNRNPAFIKKKGRWFISSRRHLCDDKSDETVLSPGDFWKIYVR